MLDDTSNTNDSTGAGDNTTPQEQGYPGQYPPEAGILHAREIYAVAYIRNLPSELQAAVERILKTTDNLRQPAGFNPDMLADQPFETWAEASRVILYLNDVYRGVYDDNGGFMPVDGHNDPRYLNTGDASGRAAMSAGGEIPHVGNLTAGEIELIKAYRSQNPLQVWRAAAADLRRHFTTLTPVQRIAADVIGYLALNGYLDESDLAAESGYALIDAVGDRIKSGLLTVGRDDVLGVFDPEEA